MIHKSGFITIMGKPNVGKSTLINSILNRKIAITSNKVQTTRHRITGVLDTDAYQMVFVDTPGIHKPKHLLGRSIDQVSFNALLDVDYVLWVVDQPFQPYDERLVEFLTNAKAKVLLVINKIDELNKKSDIDNIILSYINNYEFEAVIPISAKNQTNINHLIDELYKLLEEGPKYYPANYITDQSEAVMISELVRHEILVHTKEEIPHSVAVVLESKEENKNTNTIDINLAIIVERSSQKQIIIGKEGQMIKEIGRKARIEINKLLGRKTHLNLWVKTKKDWRNNLNDLKRFGYSEE